MRFLRIGQTVINPLAIAKFKYFAVEDATQSGEPEVIRNGVEVFYIGGAREELDGDEACRVFRNMEAMVAEFYRSGPFKD